MEERRRAERELEDMVEVLEARGAAQPHAHLTEPPDREPVAGREADVLLLDAAVGLENAGTAVRVALEVAAVCLAEALPGGPIDVVDRPVGVRRQPAGDERLAQAFGCDGQVRERGEAAEALTQQAPAVHSKLAADPLRVPDDRVRPEVGEVGRLVRDGLAWDLRPDGGGAPGAALVEQQDAVLRERPLHPARGRAGGTRGLESRAALEEHEVGAIRALRVCNLAGEHGDRRPVGAGVVQRDAVLALGEDGARDAVVGGHREGSPYQRWWTRGLIRVS